MHEKQTILIVDDVAENLDVLSGVLRPRYRVKAALNGERALAIATAEPHPDMILLDIMMPGMDGHEVCRRLKSDPATDGIPVVFVTARNQVEDERIGLELGAVDYLTKPVSPPIVEARVRTHLALYDQQRELARQVRERTGELEQTRLEIIRRLGRAAEFRDNETGLHVIRIGHFSRVLARAYGGGEDWVDLVYSAAPMHDVGKIGIPDRILLKPDRLDADEWALMRRHAEFGAAIIGEHPSPLLRMAGEIALTHHEKWDGSGYPRGLAGEAIPLEGRIVALADVFDALTTERPYKQAWPLENALDFLRENSGSHFDPGLVSIFEQVLPEILEIRARYGEDTAGDDPQIPRDGR